MSLPLQFWVLCLGWLKGWDGTWYSWLWGLLGMVWFSVHHCAHFCFDLISLTMVLTDDYPIQNAVLNFCQFPNMQWDCCWSSLYGVTAESPLVPVCLCSSQVADTEKPRPEFHWLNLTQWPVLMGIGLFLVMAVFHTADTSICIQVIVWTSVFLSLGYTFRNRWVIWQFYDESFEELAECFPRLHPFHSCQWCMAIPIFRLCIFVSQLLQPPQQVCCVSQWLWCMFLS